jgi:multicomponent K+:H+ antiporter subunit A
MTEATSLLALICWPFLAAISLLLARGAQRGVHTIIAGTCSAAGLAILLSHTDAVLSGQTLTLRLAWVPLLGLDFSLWLDPLALLFAGLILGIGLLVMIYAAAIWARRSQRRASCRS